MSGLPTGTVTFLFTDIAGSTKMLEQHPQAYHAAVTRHHDLLRAAVQEHEGTVFETVGDAVYGAFAQPSAAAAAALRGQLALQAEPWGELGSLTVRMALHTGEVECQGAHYFGVPLYRCARLLATAHGGQVVLSGATADLVRDDLPDGAGLRDLGEHRLKDLSRPERLYQLLYSTLPDTFPPLRTLDAVPNNLPAQLTSFVGRVQESAELMRLLRSVRLLTLTGPGGVGKTRLAVQVAAELLEHYPHGVWMVELAPLAEPALVPQAVAMALGVREEAGHPLLATLADTLKMQNILLLLDNCEHLVGACAELADALLRACGHLQILATSREVLGIAGETAWRVPSLSLPETPPAPSPAGPVLTQCEAVRLFVDRATAARPGFAVTAHNSPAVAQVCQRLDGIPLALELAAARLSGLTVEQLAARLDQRFRLLTGGSRTALPRHQTLHALVDWSYDLLRETERVLFERLAVFAGGFTLEAAENVCSGGAMATEDVLDLLLRLVDKSLVVAEEGSGDGERYRLLETLRQYAREKLAARGDAPAVYARHAAYYLALAEHEEAEASAILSTVLDRLEREHDNLRAALRWFTEEGDAERTLRLAGALHVFWGIHGYFGEGQQWLEAAITGGSAVAASVRTKALADAGDLAVWRGDYAAAYPLLAESLALSRALADGRGVARALRLTGRIARYQGAYAEARVALEESVMVAQETGNPEALSRSLFDLGMLARQEGDSTRAQSLLAQALERGRAVGHPAVLGSVLYGLGRVAEDRGDAVQARALYGESTAHLRGLGFRGLLAFDLEGFARLALSEGQAGRALRLAAAAAALRESMGTRLPPVLQPEVARTVAQARQALSPPDAAAAWAAGQAMTLEQALADALVPAQPV